MTACFALLALFCCACFVLCLLWLLWLLGLLWSRGLLTCIPYVLSYLGSRWGHCSLRASKPSFGKLEDLEALSPEWPPGVAKRLESQAETAPQSALLDTLAASTVRLCKPGCTETFCHRSPRGALKRKPPKWSQCLEMLEETRSSVRTCFFSTRTRRMFLLKTQWNKRDRTLRSPIPIAEALPRRF